jgi:hypothetical protein
MRAAFGANSACWSTSANTRLEPVYTGQTKLLRHRGRNVSMTLLFLPGWWNW